MARRSLSMSVHFGMLDDPRVDRTKKHLLVDIVCLSICAVIAGAEGWEDIEEFGEQKEAWLRTFLKLPHGIPSHDTIARVFRLLDSDRFEASFRDWICIVNQHLGTQHIAIDGKALRHSYDKLSMKGMLHLVSAWSVDNRLVLAQQAVDEKSNEITALPELLKALQLQGAIVTIDAMGCQKEIAAQIVEQGGDYLLALKDNHPKLFAAVQQYFEKLHLEGRFTRAQKRLTEDDSHGRREEREYYQVPLPPELAWVAEEWAGCCSLGQCISYAERQGQETGDVRYYLCTTPVNAREFGAGVRGHWSIENSQHYVLDVTFREDESRIRKDDGPENFARLRRIALNILQLDKSKGSIRRKRKRAAWNEAELLNMLKTAITGSK
jgi:predicted transposase YbfD/YdcC